MKFQIPFIFFIGVYSVFGKTSFIPKGQRAEIFELTDNEVPVFRITLPKEEFKLLKYKASSIKDDDFDKANLQIKKVVELVNKQNFTEIFPGYNFKKKLPELPMNKNGHPNIDYKKYSCTLYLFNSMNIKQPKYCFIYAFNNNSYLNLIKVFNTLSKLDISSEADEKFISLINALGKKVKIDEDGKVVIDLGEGYTYYENKDDDDPFIKDYFGYNYIYDLPSDNSNDDLPSDNSNDDSPSYYPSNNSPSYHSSNDSQSNHSSKDSQNYHTDDDDNDSSNDGYFDSFYKYFIDMFNPKKNDESDSSSQAVFEEEDINSLSQDIYDSPSNADYICDEESTDCSNHHQSNQSKDNDDDIKPSFDNSNYYYPSFENSEKFNEYFEKHFENYDFDKKKSENEDCDEFDFKTKNATLTVEINNQKKSFKKISFSLGGEFSRYFAKPGFNLKIRGENELFGRRQFKLRGDGSDPSLMRTKLISDVHNRLGIPSLSANYATLYINNEYMGLYVFTDAYKESWIEYVYGEKDTSLLYKSNKCDLTYDCRSKYENENKEATNTKELYKFLTRMSVAESPSDVETVFDLDQFYKEIAIDVLTSSFDHLYHNYYIYKHKDKWVYLSHDFDLDMGSIRYGPTMRVTDLYGNKIIKKFISKDMPRFKKIMEEIVTKAFNPATLFPHIDELKKFIRPYVKLDKTPNDKGLYPGAINYRSNDEIYSMKVWEDSIEFKNLNRGIYAIKKFILLKYRVVCKEYDLECDPVYLDKHYGMAHNNTSETVKESSGKKIIIEDDAEPTQSTKVSPSETIVASPSNEINNNTNFKEVKNDNINNSIQCLAELVGYSCCSPKLTTVYQQDEYGDWSYDFSKQEWCGLTKYEDFPSKNQEQKQDQKQEQCWSEELGYPCCYGCKVYEKDSDGEWGYELNHWCGIISSRCNKQK